MKNTLLPPSPPQRFVYTCQCPSDMQRTLNPDLSLGPPNVNCAPTYFRRAHRARYPFTATTAPTPFPAFASASADYDDDATQTYNHSDDEMEVEEAQEDEVAEGLAPPAPLPRVPIKAARAVRRKEVLGSAENPIDCTLPDPLHHFIDLTKQ